MRGFPDPSRTILDTVRLALVLCVVASALPSWAEDEPGTAVILTTSRDGWKITVNGKPQSNGTFTMIVAPLKGEPVRFTINVVAKMKPKQITRDVWKELSLAAGADSKVMKKGNTVVDISKANTKAPGVALEITDQKLSGMSLTISAK